LFLIGELVEEGQPHESVANVCRHRAGAVGAREVASGKLRLVKREVVKHRVDSAFPEVSDECGATRERGHQQVIHVPGLLAVRRDERLGDSVLRAPGAELVIIALPEVGALFLDAAPVFQLGVKEGGQDVADQVAAAEIDPGIFVHLATEEAGAIGAFFADDFGAFDQSGVVDQESTAFAAGEVFGFVETLRGERTEGPEPASAVFPKQAVGIVLDNGDAVLMGKSNDGIHLAAHAGVMHRNDGSGARGNEVRKEAFVEVKGVSSSIAEYGPRAAQHKGVDG